MSNEASNKEHFDLAIIGGGPAGLSAAISAANLALKKYKKYRIGIFESQEKIGKTILKTGNGRCNFSNYYILENKGDEYYNKKFCNQVMNECEKVALKNNLFNARDNNEINVALNMVEYLGLACYYDEDGRMYPYTNKASSVVDVLRYKINELGIKVNCNYLLNSIKKDRFNKNYELCFKEKSKVYAKKVIFAIGPIKNVEKLFKKYIIPFKKMLGPIKTENSFLKNLDGIKAHVKCSIIDNNKELKSEIGEILFRKYGVSGICIFNLSRFVNKNNKQQLIIDFAPEDSFENLHKLVIERFNNFEKNKNNEILIERLFAGMVLPNIILRISKYSGIDNKYIKKSDIKKICCSLKCLKLDILGIGDEKQCQISRGGIDVDSINSKTMESKAMKNVFFAGEIVDVDGPCGGYNLHWAWTSGILAGFSAINNLLDCGKK